MKRLPATAGQKATKVLQIRDAGLLVRTADHYEELAAPLKPTDDSRGSTPFLALPRPVPAGYRKNPRYVERAGA
jgi:hypothetical protein